MSGAHHHHHHDHDHDHGHHHHAPASFGRAFAIGIALNSAFVVIEATYGFLAGSMALVADAGHNLSDVLSLAVAWAASVLAARPPSARFTYGYKSSSILAALLNAALLMIALGAILVETIHRLIAPQPVAAGPGHGRGGHRHRDQYADGAAVPARPRARHQHSRRLSPHGRRRCRLGRGRRGRRADPGHRRLVDRSGHQPHHRRGDRVGTWGLAKDSLKMGLHGVPASVDGHAVEHHLEALPGVSAVHDLHIWPMSTTETAMTAHLVMPSGHPGDAFLTSLAETLEHDFGICHATVQIETADHAGHACAPACRPRAKVA